MGSRNWLGLPAHAVSLTLSSSPNDLSNLFVGDSVDVTVNLGGLGGAQLSALGGTVEFPSAVFGTPTSSAAGSIVPDPSDLFLTALPGFMDGQFFAFNGGDIISDGDFFTFQITAVAPGSGVIAFDPLSLFAIDEENEPMFAFDTNELSFTVRERETGEPGNAIPEPATAALGMLSMGAAALAAARRRRA